MKNHVGAFALLLSLALAGAGNALAQDTAAAGAKCSAATLDGMYLFAFDGATIGEKSESPFAVAGYEVYDGHGNVQAVQTASINGTIARNVHITGKYVVNEDCTCSIEYSDGSHFDQFLAPDGSSFSFVQTDKGSVASGFEPRAMAHRVAN